MKTKTKMYDILNYLPSLAPIDKFSSSDSSGSSSGNIFSRKFPTKLLWPLTAQFHASRGRLSKKVIRRTGPQIGKEMMMRIKIIIAPVHAIIFLTVPIVILFFLRSPDYFANSIVTFICDISIAIAFSTLYMPLSIALITLRISSGFYSLLSYSPWCRTERIFPTVTGAEASTI